MKSLVLAVIVGFALQAAATTSQMTSSSAETTSQTTSSSAATIPLTTSSPTTDKSISTSASFTTTTTTTVPDISICLNGGMFDGIKCICPMMYYGPICESILDRVPPLKTVETKVKVELKINNRELDDLMDNISAEYKEFEKEFKDLMRDAYSDLEGYKDVEIVELKSGSIIVDHNVIVEVEYKEDVAIEDEYKSILQQVTETVNMVKEASQDCTGRSFCFDPDYGEVTEVEIPNTDYCKEILGPELQDFYTQKVTAEGLICISHCDTLSDKRVDCNSGRCVIQKGTGVQCYCPRTDLYMYTGSKCTGKILKSGLYGGIGAAIGVLVIIVAIIGFLLCRTKKKINRDTKKDNVNQYEYIEHEFNHDKGRNKLAQRM